MSGLQLAGPVGSSLRFLIVALAEGANAPQFRTLPTRRSFLSQLGLLAAGAGAIWWFRDNILWPSPGVAFESEAQSTGWLPFGRRRGGLVIVEAAVNGSPVNALIDSGAQYSVVDRALADRLALASPLDPPMIAYGAGGNPQVGRGARADIRIGDVTLSGLAAAVLELGPISQMAGLQVPLILGQDVLNRLTADIDFPNRRVRLHTPGAFPLPPEAMAAPVRREGRALLASVVLEGEPLDVIVDTGASGALALSRTVAQTMGLLDGREVRPGSSIVLGGVAQGGVVQASSLQFGGLALEDVDVQIFPLPALPGFPRGLLGLEVLRPYRAILDLAEGTLHLAPGDAADA